MYRGKMFQVFPIDLDINIYVSIRLLQELRPKLCHFCVKLYM